MPKRYKLTITNPCSVPWLEMTPSEQGRFCINCAKNVVDFTLMSDAQIAQYIENAKGEICGRLTVAQLDRVYSVGKTYRHQPQLAKYLAALLLLQTSNYPIDAHAEELATEWVRPVNLAPPPASKMPAVASDSLLIKGIILDAATLQPVNEAMVRVQHPSRYQITDSTGRFEVWVPANGQSTVYLEFWGRHHATRTMTIATDKLPVEIQIILPKESADVYGGLQVFDYLEPDTTQKQ